VKRVELVRAGVLLGLFCGVWDAIAVVLENPRSFTGVLSPAALVGAAIALYVIAGAAAVALLALSGLGARLRAGFVLAGGLALWLFLWFGIRVHVRFFFGSPLLAPASLAVNALLFVAAALVSAGVWRWLGPGWRASVRRPLPAVAGVVLMLLGVGLAIVGVPHRTPPAPAGASALESNRDVLLITLDTTRADHLSCYGYPRGTTPAIDRLARHGFLVRNVHAPIPLTNPSHVSIFTGLLPREHGVLNNGTALADTIPTFARSLAEAGYRCAAFVSGIPLKAGLSGLADGFGVYDDVFSPLERVHPMLTSLALVRAANRVLPIDFVERRAEATVAAAVRWLRESTPPRFLWVHLFEPHTPYDAPAILRARFAREAQGWTAHGREVTGWPLADYDAELREADRQLEALLETFVSVTQGEGTVLFASDHGEGLEQHGVLAHGTQLYQEDVVVPLLAAGPGLELLRRESVRGGILRGASAERLHERVRSLVAVGGPARALFAPPDEGAGERECLLIETFAPEGRQNQSAVVDDSAGEELAKLLVNWDTGEERIYDLESDPGETRPVLSAGPQWDRLRSCLPSPPPGVASAIDPETERRLRSLGYLH
jgi:hypothetical protein